MEPMSTIDWAEAPEMALTTVAVQYGFKYAFLAEIAHHDPRRFLAELREIKAWCTDQFGEAQPMDLIQERSFMRARNRLGQAGMRWNWSEYYFFFNRDADAVAFKVRWF